MDAVPDTQITLHRTYYMGFVVVLVACFSPFKIVGYIAPALFTAWISVASNNRVMRTRLVALAFTAIVIGLFYALLAPEFLVANYLLALVTYSAFLPILAIDSQALASVALYRRMLTTTASMMLFQGALGIVQYAYGVVDTGRFGEGDYVEGTIHPQLSSDANFSNPIFAVNITLMLLACISMPGVLTKGRAKLVVGAVALVMASVFHVLVFLLGGFVIARIATRVRVRTSGPRKPRSKWMLALLVVGGLGAATFPVRLLSTYAGDVLDMEALAVPRAILMYRVFTELPHDAPLQPYIGLGPGHFSSRASLIASGLYLGGPDTPKVVPLMTPQVTYLALEYCISLLLAFIDSEAVGSTQQPFSSFMSVYTELGLVGLVLILWTVLRIVRRVQTTLRVHPQRRPQAVAFCTGVFFLLLLGFQENYWEAPQAILVGLLLLKALYATLVHGADDHEVTEAR